MFKQILKVPVVMQFPSCICIVLSSACLIRFACSPLFTSSATVDGPRSRANVPKRPASARRRDRYHVFGSTIHRYGLCHLSVYQGCLSASKQNFHLFPCKGNFPACGLQQTFVKPAG